jgi:hypothetical protein
MKAERIASLIVLPQGLRGLPPDVHQPSDSYNSGLGGVKVPETLRGRDRSRGWREDGRLQEAIYRQCRDIKPPQAAALPF